MATRNRYYPHLLDPDIDVWEQFLPAYGMLYTSFDYDIRVGKGRDPGPYVQDKYRKVGIELSQKRIDAVGHRPGRIDIIEITVHADLKTLGQLIAYPDLYASTFNYRGPIQPVLVAREISSDLTPAILKHQIKTYLFPQ